MIDVTFSVSNIGARRLVHVLGNANADLGDAGLDSALLYRVRRALDRSIAQQDAKKAEDKAAKLRVKNLLPVPRSETVKENR